MKHFGTSLSIEFILLVRNFFGFFFALIFPVLMLVLFGSIYGNTPIPGSDQTVISSSTPAYCAMVIGVAGLMSFPLTLAECKDKKIYKRFDATPVGKKQIIWAQLIVNLLLTALGIAILLATAAVVYDVRCEGSIWRVMFATLLSIAAMFSIGFLFSAIGNAKIANLLCYLTYFVMIFLSGATMPAWLFPESVKNVSRFLPMTYSVELVQGVFAGDTLGAHSEAIWILVAVTAACAGIGALLYAKRDWT